MPTSSTHVRDPTQEAIVMKKLEAVYTPVQHRRLAQSQDERVANESPPLVVPHELRL